MKKSNAPMMFLGKTGRGEEGGEREKERRQGSQCLRTERRRSLIVLIVVFDVL